MPKMQTNTVAAPQPVRGGTGRVLGVEDYKTRGAWQWQTREGYRLDSEVHSALSEAARV